MRSLVTQFLLLIAIALLGLLCARLYLFVDGYKPLAIPSIAAVTTDQSATNRSDTASSDLRTREIVRQVVREELARVESDLSVLISDEVQRLAKTLSQSTIGPAASNPPPNASLKAEVDSEIYAMISQGNASPSEMASLQSKIARLPDSQRREALSEISRAMNDGRLAATF